MMEHPGIVFRDGPTGRRAALVSGPDIWEVVGGVRGVRDDGELSTVASDLGLTRPQLDAALRYYADFRLVASSAYPRDRANTDATIGRVVRALDALLTARPGPSDSLLVWLGDP